MEEAMSKKLKVQGPATPEEVEAALKASTKHKVTQGYLGIRFIGRSLPMHSGARVCAIEVKKF